MKSEEYHEILQLLYTIQKIAYDKYTNIYMPRFNALGGSELHPTILPVKLEEIRPLISVDEAIQMTNIAFVYQLHHSIALRPKMMQNQPPMRTNYQMEIDGINYMALLTNEMTKIKGMTNRSQIIELSYQTTYQDIMAVLRAIYGELLKL